MWWMLLIAVLGFVFWVHYSHSMSASDRVAVALDLLKSSEFAPAEGFEDAVVEDPTLSGWIQSGRDCVMHFRSEENGTVEEIVDFASTCFHPGLVIHYENGRAVRTAEGPIEDSAARQAAEDLLAGVRAATQPAQAESSEYDGCHY